MIAEVNMQTDCRLDFADDSVISLLDDSEMSHAWPSCEEAFLHLIVTKTKDVY